MGIESNKKSNLACVVIPIYKNELSETEEISFRQVLNVLNKYDVIIICPISLNITNYETDKNSIKVTRFEDKYFKNTTSYSNLLIKSSFYKTFLCYKYLLIYQLDAYVFHDELAFWCKQEYDYIGAPWINDEWIKQFKQDVKKGTGIQLPMSFIKRVGNGGFSLRKTKTFYLNSLIFGKLWYLWKRNEDFYWSNIFPKLNPFFKIPPVSVALNFAFDLDPEKCFNINNQKMPFGCHAWEKDKKEFYKGKII